MQNKYVKVNFYNRAYPKYVPVNERSEKMNIFKIAIQTIIGFALVWLALWAFTYIVCVSNYHSNACKQDITSQLVIKLIK